MNRQLAQQPAPRASSFTPPPRTMLQRKCACGTHMPGGGKCAACEGKKNGLQRKLSLGSTSDPLEHEADRVAEQVMARPGPTGVARGPVAVQRLTGTDAEATEEVPASVSQALAAPGRPLDPATRTNMEQRFGRDFSQVRVHDGGIAERSARDVGARAYTVGNDVFFGPGQFAPATGDGQRLLAHELVHVLQQSSPPKPSGGLSASNAQTGTGEGRILQRTPAAPTNASGTAVQDLARLRIDPIADFVASSLTAPRTINANINDAAVAHMTWLLYDPSDQMMSGSFSTMPGRPNSTSAPFTLEPSHFSGAGFTPGKYLLRCIGLGSDHQPVVYADRDFNVLRADLTTGTPLATTYGSLTYTEYRSTNATAANPRFSVNVTLAFLPNNSVNCSQVGWIQAVQALNANGTSRQANINAEHDARKTPLAWAIDQTMGAPSPFYVMDRNAAGAAVADPGYGSFGSGGAAPTAASLIDVPSSSAPVVYRFEACAVCRTGASAGQVYGCTTWGYRSNTAGQVTLMPRGFRQMPSDQFEEARAAWNTWRTTVSAPNQPDAAPALRSP